MKIFINKILHIKSINNKIIVKQNTDEFICQGYTQTSDFEETENETEGDNDDGEVDDNGEDDDNGDDDCDAEFVDDDNGKDGGDNDGNHVDGVTVNGDVSNIKHLIGET